MTTVDVALPGFDDGPAEITLACDLCKDTVTGRPSGPGSAPMKLGLHKRRAHGVAGKKRTKGEPSLDNLSGANGSARAVVAGVRDMAAQITSKGVPTADELANAFGTGISVTSVFGASLVVDSDKSVQTEEHRSALIDGLSLPKDVARDVMHPIARMLAPTRINTRYGRAIVDNVDVLGSFQELILFGARWRDYLRDRRDYDQARLAAAANGAHLSVVPAPAMQQPGPVQAATPAPMAGRVVSGADLRPTQQQGEPNA